jgi:hypothetical protein
MTHDTDFSGIWAVTWRSFLMLPVGLILFAAFVSLVAAFLLPPFFGVACLFSGLWWQGITAFVIWSLEIWAWRHLRLTRFFA